MDLDGDVCYRATSSRDSRFDGRFFIGVVTTGVYCRPICPVRCPKRQNMRFYASAAAAEAAGFRACMRCRPDVAPTSAAWHGTSATVSRALSLIDAGALDHHGIDDLARRLGIGARHLRRLFLEHLGAPPSAVARTRRAHYARVLLEQTRMPMIEVAWAAGFESLRRFNACMRDSFGRAPRELRRKPAARPVIELRLAYRAPLDWSGVMAWLAARVIHGVESVTGDVYERDGVRIEHQADRRVVTVSLLAGEPSRLRDVVGRARRLFDLDTDPNVIESHLSRDPLLASLIGRAPGIRVPGTWDPFELAVRAIVGQQVSVAAARTIIGRIAEKHGIDAVRLSDVTVAGMPTRRAETIRALASAVASGTLVLERAPTLEQSIAMLRAMPGIGPWTAHYIAMRALGEPDAFPAGDLILRRNAGNLTEKELLRRAEAWRPWRAYAAMLLWTRI